MAGTHGTQVFAGSFPAAEVAELAKGALQAGDSVLLILQPRRLANLRQRLAKEPRCTFVSTHDALAAMTRDGELRPELVESVLGQAIAEAGKGGNGRVAILTDAAGTLVLADRHSDSRVLENLCHGVCRAGPVFLTCVYPIEAYQGLRHGSKDARQDFRREHHLA